MSEPGLSIVIPAFNEAARLPQTLRSIVAHMASRGERYEIVVVDDGSTDGTAERASAAAAIVLVRNERNRGKGFSVRRGMLLARGALRLMTDADLSTPIQELDRLRAKLAEGFDVVIASRALPEARIEVRQPLLRETLGRVFNGFVRAVALPGLRDTQCGFKLFTARAAEEVFGLARLDGFSFDVEALVIARGMGRRIAEVPVTWRNDAATRVTLARGMAAFLDLLRIRANAWAGRYRPAQRL